MRAYLFLLILCGAIIPASAQIFVNKVDVNTRSVQYIEVWEKYNKGSDKFFAMLDYGQQDDIKDKEGQNLFVTNLQGQYLEFNGIVDVLNFMYRNGWEVLHVKTIGDYESYILKKKARQASAQVVSEPIKKSVKAPMKPKVTAKTQKAADPKKSVSKKAAMKITEKE